MWCREDGDGLAAVVKGGAVAVGAGVMTLALPSIAAASSNPTTLGGYWYWSNEYAVELEGLPDATPLFQNPTWNRHFSLELPEAFVLASGRPSALTFGSEQFSYIGSGGESSAPGENGRFLFINGDQETFSPVEKTDPLEGDLTGTFTWGGATYTVTFRQTPNQPLVR